MRSILLVFLLGSSALWNGGVASAAFDQIDLPPAPGQGHPRFLVDSGSFLSSTGPEVSVALRVPYAELFFEKQEKTYRARFDVLIVLREGKRQVGGDLWPQTLEVARYADTKARDIYFQKVVRLPAQPGKLDAEVTLSEPLSGRRNEVKWELEVPDYQKEELSLSTLWVIGCEDSLAIGKGDSGAVVLPPADWVLTHRYGEPLRALCVVGEVYRKQGGSPARLSWKVVDERRLEVGGGEVQVPDGNPAPFRFRPDLSSLWLGTYVMDVTIKTADAHARRQFVFQMDESMVSIESNMDQSLDLVRLIARSGEIDSLEHSSPVERKEAWVRFWKRRDPTPDTDENEFKTEFFDRVRYANENFAVLEPGWKSDRGRVYIQYGAPDQIDQHAQNVDGPPYEVWIYDRLNRRFVFVDYDGFGRYELYQPGR